MERLYQCRMDVQQAWDTLCVPAQIYPVVMIAVILFSLYRGAYREAVTNIVGLIIGTMLLWVLCAAGMEFVAYGLLILPIIFFLFFAAIVLFDRSLLNITHRYKRCGHPENQPCGCHRPKKRCGCERQLICNHDTD